MTAQTTTQRTAKHRLAVKERMARMTLALEIILQANQERHWTATRDNPETHWEIMDGPYAKIAREALSGTATPTITPKTP